MARQEKDREDLLADATALIHRAEWNMPDSGSPVVVGFRADGALSVYFGPDPVFHFNSDGQLRRAYVDGKIIKAKQGRLISLRRDRTGEAVHLISREVGDGEAEAFLANLTSRLQDLAGALAAGRCKLVGQIPEDIDVATRFQATLPLVIPPVIAHTPRL